MLQCDFNFTTILSPFRPVLPSHESGGSTACCWFCSMLALFTVSSSSSLSLFFPFSAVLSFSPFPSFSPYFLSSSSRLSVFFFPFYLFPCFFFLFLFFLPLFCIPLLCLLSFLYAFRHFSVRSSPPPLLFCFPRG